MNTTSANHKTPFIKKFRTDDTCYIYDVNTNEILAVDEVVFAVIDDVGNLSDDEIVEKWAAQFERREDVVRAVKEIRAAQAADNLFSAGRPARISPYGGGDLRACLEKVVCQQLILGVTENCNLRCRYCVYGGKYPGRRIHSPKRMSCSTAEKALDLFLGQTADSGEPNDPEKADISFFGGEPLSNFELIKHCVAYVEDRRPGEYSFGSTTNGTLLTDRVVDYLVEKGFRLRVSLDGPQDVHDRYRVDGQGRGTWGAVMHNLERLHDRHPQYAETKLGFEAVAVSNRAMLSVKQFFEEHAWLSKMVVTATYPNYTPNQFVSAQEGPAESGSGDAPVDFDRICEEQLIRNHRLTPFLQGRFLNGLGQIYRREGHHGFPQGAPINGCCIPGQRRMFVSCDGTLFVCERFDAGYPIGTVDRGLDIDSVLKLVGDYQDLCSTCLDCWAVRFCSKCFASFFSDGKFDEKFRAAECRAFKADFERKLVLYQRVLEKDPEALQFLADVHFS